MLAASLAALTLLAPQPTIVHSPIPYGPGRRRQMAAYSRRHYGNATSRLRPRVIVLHFTANNSYSATWNTFASNAANRGEKPGTCAQFVVDQDGTVYQLTRLSVRCRHTIGLNQTSIGIEMVQEGRSGKHGADRAILGRKKQIRAATKLTAWLKQRYRIGMRNVIGHSMANDSRYFKDLEGWRNDHVDWLRGDVRKYRKIVAKVIRKHR